MLPEHHGRGLQPLGRAGWKAALNLGSMKPTGADALILAVSDTVWEVLTDAGNYPVWGSGITTIDGSIHDRATIRVTVRGQGEKAYRFRVRLLAGHQMTWTHRLPLGLLTFVRTFTLTNHAGFTRLTVHDTSRGLLHRLLPRANPPVSRFVEEVKFRAELLSFHLNGGIFPNPNKTDSLGNDSPP